MSKDIAVKCLSIPLISPQSSSWSPKINMPINPQAMLTWHFIDISTDTQAAFLWGDPDLDQWSKICVDHDASKELANPLWSWIHRFLWCTMIQTDLGFLIRIRITPKEHSLYRYSVDSQPDVDQLICIDRKLVHRPHIYYMSKFRGPLTTNQTAPLPFQYSPSLENLTHLQT